MVATKLSGAQKTQILHVDLTTGRVTVLGRFLQDGLTPLALGIDPLNGDGVLALDLGVQSRVLRFAVSGTKIVQVRQLADVPGKISAIGFYSDAIHVASVGTTGGIYRFPRNGAKPTLITKIPRATALFSQAVLQSAVWVAESGQATPAADPGMRLVDVASGKTLNGPYSFKGHKPVTLTGIAEIPTALFRHLYTDTSGQLLLGVMFATPTVLTVTPKLSAGATRALRMRSQFEAVVLGGSIHPYLNATQAFSSKMIWKRLAGPLPGNPVAFDFVPRLAPALLPFGKSCSTTSQSKPTLGWSGTPTLGTKTFSIQVRGTSPSASLVFVLAASDQRLGTLPLPLTLPGGCQLLCSLDFIIGMTSSPAGFATLPLPIPNQVGLLGSPLFTQWIQIQPGPTLGFATSAAASILVGK